MNLTIGNALRFKALRQKLAKTQRVPSDDAHNQNQHADLEETLK
jgi:hypothetical protein